MGSLLSPKELKVDVKTVRDPAHAPIEDVLNGLSGFLGFILRLLEEKLRYYLLL